MRTSRHAAVVATASTAAVAGLCAALGGDVLGWPAAKACEGLLAVSAWLRRR